MEDETTKLKKRSLEEHPILDLNLPRKKKWKKQEEIIEDPNIGELIDTYDKFKIAIKILLQQKIIAADCEWSGVGRDSELSLIQVAYQINDKNKVFIFDLLSKESDKFLENGLKELFESENIVKIFHDCRWDSDILWRQCKIKLTNVIDTQILFATYQRQSTSKTPLPVSLNKLLKFFAFGNINALKSSEHKEMEKSPDYWKTRPLTETMLEYARADVLHLITVYRQLKAGLDERNYHLVVSRSKFYTSYYRELEEISQQEFIPGVTLPKYGIEEWDTETAQQIEYKKHKVFSIGRRRKF